MERTSTRYRFQIKNLSTGAVEEIKLPSKAITFSVDHIRNGKALKGIRLIEKTDSLEKTENYLSQVAEKLADYEENPKSLNVALVSDDGTKEYRIIEFTITNVSFIGRLNGDEQSDSLFEQELELK